MGEQLVWIDPDRSVQRVRERLGLNEVRSALPVTQEALSAAASIAAVTEKAVSKAIGALAPYGSRRDTFQATADIEHRAPDGSTTRARLNFEFHGGDGR